MKKNIRVIILGVSVVLLILIGMLIYNLYNKGFKFYTYSTDNLLLEQIEGIMKIDTGENYNNKINKLDIKNINEQYIGLFYIDGEEDGQCLIAKYSEKFNLGKNKVLNLDKVIKSSNSVVMLDLSSETNKEYIILISNKDDKYEEVNIVTSSSGEIIDNIELSDEGMQEVNGEKIDDYIYYIKYEPEIQGNIGIELVKKSE